MLLLLNPKLHPECQEKCQKWSKQKWSSLSIIRLSTFFCFSNPNSDLETILQQVLALSVAGIACAGIEDENVVSRFFGNYRKIFEREVRKAKLTLASTAEEFLPYLRR